MAKRRKQSDAAAERTTEAIAKLKRYYDLGRRAQKLGKSNEGAYAPGVIAQLAEETGEERATLNKCRQFADQYAAADFKELCQLRRPDGKPIGWGHVTKLLTIPQENKKLRAKLQSLAATEGWTARRLESEIGEHYESVGSRGGRPSKLPTSKSEALRQVLQRSQQWLRWYEGFENAEGLSVSDLPNEVQTRVKAVVREIRKLETVVQEA